jgi:peptidoglycan hydrolase-like protein with peptidoglycan-binding domain
MLVLSVVFVTAVPSFVDAVQGVTFFRSLSMGSVGEDVRELQKILNSSPETAIKSLGAGSPGQETTYFGALTRDAVMRFQEKYRDEILIPNGLSRGTGIVGPSTRGVLHDLLQVEVGTNAPSTSLSDIGVTPPTQPSGITSTNPNEENLDIFLANIDRVGAQQGLSEEKLTPLKEQIKKDIATTTNLKKTFIEIVEKSISKAPEPTRDPLSKLLDSIKSAFVPKDALAFGTPFGGQLYFSFFCPCSGNWLVTIQPLPPTYVALLSYTPGTQAHLSYNIPFTTRLLGQYTPGAGMCSIFIGTGCATLPSEGLITPTVGSSGI